MRTTNGKYDDRVVFDPATIFNDALNFTPWKGEEGHLPQRGEWSSFRYAAKDIIFGVTTFRFDETRRRLHIKVYYVGEHPMFNELEPTRALLVVLLCQCWQTGRSLELHFEGGIPVDVRALIEIRLGKQIDGHEETLLEAITVPLFAELSGLTQLELAQVETEVTPAADVCYSIYRGIWSASQVRAMLVRRVPLKWVFQRAPGAVTSPLSFWYLVQHLRAILIEEYVLRRMENRPLGQSLGLKIEAVPDGIDGSKYRTHTGFHLEEPDARVDVKAEQEFTIVPIMPVHEIGLRAAVLDFIARIPAAEDCAFVVGFTLDSVYLASDEWEAIERILMKGKCGWVVVGLTLAHLLTEITQKLSTSIDQNDPDQTDADNADRHTD